MVENNGDLPIHPDLVLENVDKWIKETLNQIRYTIRFYHEILYDKQDELSEEVFDCVHNLLDSARNRVSSLKAEYFHYDNVNQHLWHNFDNLGQIFQILHKVQKLIWD